VDVTIVATGAGMSAERLATLFELVAGLPSPAGLRTELARARRVIDTHGGTLTAHSDGEGQNVTFTVRLPSASVARGERTPVAGGTVDIVCPPPLAGVWALVVEDQPDSRALIETVLARCHVRVVAVESVRQALDALDHHPIDVIISDMGLREDDGFTLLKLVRARPPDQGGRVPAIAMSACAGPADREQAFAVGYQTFIAKPIEPAEVLATVAALLRTS
jgi:CheY-like chemotaxis protein